MTDDTSPPRKAKRSYLMQVDLPRMSLEDALRVPRAIADNYAKQPTKPLDVATAINMSPTSGTFRDLCGAADGYGVTDGGPRAATISLTEIGRRIVAPMEEGDDLAALREAVLNPRIIREFLTKYDGNPLPSDTIAFNVLEDMDVPADATQRALATIIENAEAVGFLKPIKNKTYVDLAATQPVIGLSNGSDGDTAERQGEEHLADSTPAAEGKVDQPPVIKRAIANRRVFISHGKNRRIVEQLKELLSFGDFEPVISVERETPSKPVPEKVMDDMRSCAAGLLHVSPEQLLLDQEGNEQRVLNPNVLIEIGAAMALYNNRFILLVEEGTTLPSNLQGLYEVRYSGDELGYEATMKILKVLNEFKKDGK